MTPQQSMMSEAVSKGDIEGVKEAISHGADPKADGSWALRKAAENGHAACVKELIPVSDPKADDSIPLQLAAWGGNAECVRLLVPVSDPETVREKLTEGSLFNALVLFDSIHQEQILKAKHAGLSEAKARIPL